MRGELAKRLAASDVHHRRGAVNAAARLLAHLRELQDQLKGKVVHAVVAEILKRLERRGFSGAAHPGDHYELFRVLLRLLLHG